MEVISAGLMDVENEVLDPHHWVRGSIVWFDVHGLESFGEFVIQDLIGEAMRVCGASVSGRIMARL